MFKWFTIFEYEKEQDYLREMHKSGWKFIKVTGLGMYHFEKWLHQDVVYQLDYNISEAYQPFRAFSVFREFGNTARQRAWLWYGGMVSVWKPTFAPPLGPIQIRK